MRAANTSMHLIRNFFAAFLCAMLLALLGVSPSLAQVGGYGNPTIQSPGSANGQAGAWALHALHPLDNGALGSYAKAMVSGTIGAGLAAGSPVYSLRYNGTGVAVIRRIRVSVAGTATAFAAGNAHLDAFVARAFTASDTGGTAGTLTGNNAKLRTSFGTTGVASIQIANTGTLTAGTRTLDTDPFAAVDLAIGTGTSTQIVAPNTVLYEPKAGEFPLVLAPNEGFAIQATVPATGTWLLAVSVEWDELPSF